MSSLHRKYDQGIWYCAFTLPNGKRTQRSTGTDNRREAEKICNAMTKTADFVRAKNLTPEKARRIVSDAVEEIASLGGVKICNVTLDQWLKRWLNSISKQIASSTLDRYTSTVNMLRDFSPHKLSQGLDQFTTADAMDFRDKVAASRSNSTANLTMSVLKAIFNEAVRAEIIFRNPAAHAPTLRENPGGRRAFTIDELKAILRVAGDSEWRGMIFFGLYTLQRLGDIVRLRHKHIDLRKKEATVHVRKTGKTVILPIAPPLQEFLESFPSSDNPDALLFPELHGLLKKDRVAHISSRFYRDILVPAGLAERRGHNGKGITRAGPRKLSPLSFHSLRHTGVTMLKAAGASNAIAQAIAGHESSAMSGVYTHVSAEDMRPAMNSLPRLD